MPQHTEAGRARAEAILKGRAERKADAPIAMQDYRAAQKSLLERNKRLREERIARESAAAE